MVPQMDTVLVEELKRCSLLTPERKLTSSFAPSKSSPKDSSLGGHDDRPCKRTSFDAKNSGKLFFDLKPWQKDDSPLKIPPFRAPRLNRERLE